jgi:arginyl-tRNA synthetase
VIADTIKNLIIQALQELDLPQADFVVEHPGDITHGDYSTNVAMVLSKKVGENPKMLAEKIVVVLRQTQNDLLERIEIAGPGFINFYLSESFFTQSITQILDQGADFGKITINTGKAILIEHSSPNLFKPFHIGHVMNPLTEQIITINQF